MYRGKVRPPIFSLEKKNGKVVDEKGYEYKDYTLYIVSTEQIIFQASTLMELKGYVYPDPNTQTITLMATEVEFPEAVDNFNIQNIETLASFFSEMKSVNDCMDWILSEFEKHSRIIGRRNLAVAVLLGKFTPLFVILDGETERGFCNILIIGDTTTAKTKTSKKANELVESGPLITAETASSVGLGGAAVQTDDGWNIDWGFLVLNDKGDLTIDGAQKLGKKQWGTLAEAERSGIVTIAKAAKGAAYARTRQIKIANPVDPESRRLETKNLSEFLYPVQSASTFLDLQSIARVDLSVFAGADDVAPEQVHRTFNEKPDPRLSLLKDALKWARSKGIQHKFTPEAVTFLHTEATRLYKKFHHKQVPLASIDMNWKIARLAVAVATITVNTDDFRTILVTEEHVRWVTEFIDEEYSNAGLDQLVKHSGDKEITQELAEEILVRVGEALGAKDDPDFIQASQVLEYIAVRGRFTLNTLKEKFELSRDNKLRPLIACLNDLGLIKQSRGYNSTALLNKLIRFMSSTDFSGFSGFSILEKDTPPKNSKYIWGDT